MPTFQKNVRSYFDAVYMPGGLQFDTVGTLKTVNFYYNSKFKTGQFDTKGFRKFFFNVTKPTCDIAEKFVDLDTKDIILMPTKPDDEIKVWAMQRRLKAYLKETDFATFLNQIGHNYPKYGHVVIKKTNEGWKVVHIENIRTDPSVQWMRKSSFVYEVHVLTLAEIEARGWKTEELKTRATGPFYLVYEAYDKKKSGDKWTRTIKGGVWRNKSAGTTKETAESQINNQDQFLPPLDLTEPVEMDLPYRELKWEDVPGRWLGYGFPEYLFDNQIALNETENLERKALMHKALNLWQTRDDTVGGKNVLVDAENGDIIRTNEEITPIVKDNADLAAYNNTRGVWDGNVNRKTFTSDITTGENLPSRTPLGVANLQATLATSYFELKRENFGIFIKKLIQEEIIPDFKKDNRKEHILTFLGSDDELDKLDTLIVRARVDNAVMAHAEKTGFFPSKGERTLAEERIKDTLNKRSNRFLKIPKDFYENAGSVVDIIVTGEQKDVAAQAQLAQMALQVLQGNPGILQNKTTRAIFFYALSLGGISPVDLNLLSEDVDTTPVPQGGSIGTPQLGASATPAPVV